MKLVEQPETRYQTTLDVLCYEPKVVLSFSYTGAESAIRRLLFQYSDVEIFATS